MGCGVGVATDRDGKSVGLLHRCETATDCSSRILTIMKFDRPARW